MNPSMPLNREFTIALHSRAIDSCTDIEELRTVAKSLLSLWQQQAMVTEAFGAQMLGIVPAPAAP